MRRTPPSLGSVLAVAAAAFVAAGAAPAQDDLRDRVTRSDGREIRGRVVQPFAAELLVLQGNKRVRVDRADVASTDLVGDRLREFCERRLRHRGSPRAQRYLVDWALREQLPAIAHLQAAWLVLQDQGDDALRELLGHRRSQKEWLWPHDGRWFTLAALDAALRDAPLRLQGERFALRCDGGLATNVAALLDLESLGVAWFDRFGEQLALREVLRPVEVDAVRSVEQFAKWGFRPRPYYEPPPHQDLARTFYSGPAPERPELLFFVGTQGLLYRTLIGETNRQDDRDRVCAWLEVGLGMWMERVMQGDAGFAAPGEPTGLSVEALRALNRGYRLTHLLHLPMYASFYLTDDTATATNWSAATMFVAWLLREGNQPPTREPFFEFVRKALAEGKGDSSTAFDRIMGRRVEELDEPWRAFLAQLAGY